MLSVIVITKNEEANIRRCLASVSWADEIIVLDSGSVDKTLDIARAFTSKIHSNTDWQGYGVQKQRALSLAKGDWILHLDADESVDPTLREAIQNAIQSNEADAYRVPIGMHFYGKSLRYSYSPKRHVRLFKRAGAKFSTDIVHEKIVLPSNTRIGQLVVPITHHSFRDLSHALTKVNQYSSYSAQIRLQEKKFASFTKTLCATAWMFFRCFWLQRGFLDGKEGFLMAVLSAQGTFYRGMKQLYLDNTKMPTSTSANTDCK